MNSKLCNNKTFWISATALCLAYAGLAGSLSGQTSTQTEVRSGTVVYVSGNDLVVKRDDGVVKHFVVPDSTTVNVDGNQLSVHDLKPGMRLTRTITTTTKSEDVTTVKVVKGKVWMVNAPYLIVTLENGQNKQYKVPDGMKFNVDGQEKSVFHLKKGMNLTATIVTTTPETVVSSTSAVSGTAPVVAEAPKPATPPLVGVLLIEERAVPAPTTVASNEAPPAVEPKPERLPKTASSVPLFAVIGLFSLSAGLMLRARRSYL
jgi:LPXTG-motif cell wall-anchored protein